VPPSAKSIERFEISGESRPRENFLVTPSKFDKTAKREVCNSHVRLPCAGFAGIRGFATSFPCEIFAAF